MKEKRERKKDRGNRSKPGVSEIERKLVVEQRSKDYFKN